MLRVLIAGLPDRLASWLAQRLEGVLVEVAWTPGDALDQLRRGQWSLLVVDAAVEAAGPEAFLRRMRATPGLERLPVILAYDPQSEIDPLRTRRLVEELKIDRFLLHPLDRGELARHAAALVGRRAELGTGPAWPQAAPLPPAGSPAPAPAAARTQVEAALAGVWERARMSVVARLDAVERAIVALMDGILSPDDRREAEAEAHRLAGALGTFGSADGTRLARQIELVLGGGAPLTRPDGARLARLAASLRAEVDALDAAGAAPAPASPAPAAPPLGPPPAIGAEPWKDPRPLVLAVGLDTAAARALEAEGAGRGMRVRSVQDAARVGVALGVERPEAVVVDLAAAGEDGEAANVLPELARALPGVRLVALVDRASVPDRVRLLQLGVRAFLPRSAGAGELLEAVAAALPPAGAEPRRVLAVDDDPQILAALRALLEPQRMALTTLEDPLRFWSALEEARPEVVILDVDMPHVTGIELCRVLRADHRHAQLPVLFLTAHTDRDTLLRVFAAGADDYVTKPIVGPELFARIMARLR